MTGDWRIEHDSMGEVRVPAEHYWGAQTQRAVEHFPIGVDRYRWGRPVIRAFGILKKCAALANGELGQLPQEKVDLIVRAAQEVIDGKLDGEFPLVVFQTGSGTQTNMNANEVIANRAIQLAGGAWGRSSPIHPNDDVNHGQSSNDTFPTAMHIAAVEQIERRAGAGGRSAARHARRQGQGVRRRGDGRPHAPPGRHAADARPGDLRLGGAARPGAGRRCAPSLPGCTSWRSAARRSAPASTPTRASPRRRRAHRRGNRQAVRLGANKFAALSAHDAMVNASAALRTLAGDLMKIANDVRWYACGPRAGIGELRIPENEPGSSIMPGKVNPTQCEALTHGGRAGVRQRRRGRPSPARRAISSSTSTSP